MATKKIYANKKFLNRNGHHSDASISCTLNFWGNSSHDGEVRIRDCGRFPVSLAFGVANTGDDSYSNSMHKVSVMIEELEKFRAALRMGRKEYIKREEIVKLKNKKKKPVIKRRSI